MRTTVTIDDELLAEVKLVAARTHRTIGAVLEDAVRRALRNDLATPGSVELPDFHYAGGLRPGVDLYDHDAMAALMYEEADGNALS